MISTQVIPFILIPDRSDIVGFGNIFYFIDILITVIRFRSTP